MVQDMIRLRNLLLAIGLCMCSGSPAQTLIITPNPFENRAEWSFTLGQNDTVSLNIFNRWGSNVRTIYSKALLPAGTYNDSLDMSDLEANVYFAILETTSGIKSTAKLVKTGPVGIQQYTGSNNVLIYPNPSRAPEPIKIQTRSLIQRRYDFVVFDALGAKLSSGDLSFQNSALELPLHVGPGIYTLLIVSESGSQSFRIVRE